MARGHALRSALPRYGAALLAVAIATLLKLLLDPVLGDESPFVLLFGAVMVSALYGGLGPGLVAAGCSSVVTAYFFFPPYHSLAIAKPETQIRLLVFLAEAAFISVIGGVLRSAQRRAEESRVRLEAEVAGRGRLFGESEARRHAAEALAGVGTLISQSLNPREVQQRIVDSVRTLFGAQRAALYTVEPDSGDLVAQAVSDAPGVSAPPVQRFPRGTALMSVAVRERRPTVAADVLTDPRVVLAGDNRWQLEASGLRAVLAVPLLGKEAVVGALTVADGVGRSFDAEEIRLAQVFADQASIALENARLYQRAGERAEKLTALSRLTKVMTSAPESEEVFHAVARAATTLLGAAMSRVWVDDPEAGGLRARGGFGIDPGLVRLMTEFPVLPYGEGLSGRIFQSRAPAHLADIAEDPRWLNRRLATEGGLHGCAGLPLVRGERVLGVLMILFHERRILSAEERELLDLLADHAAIAIDNARLLSEEHTRRGQLAAVLEINKKIGTVTSSEALLNSIAEEAARLLDVDNAGFRLVDGDELVLAGVAGTARETMVRPRIKIGESMTGKVVAEKRTLVLEIDHVTDVIPEHRAADVRLGYATFLGVPVQIGDRILGVLAFRARRPFTARDRELAEAFAGQAAIAIEHSRLYREAQEAYDKLSRAQTQLVRGETLRAVGELAAGAAHHLNNLLAVVLGRLQLALRKFDSPELRRELGPAEAAVKDGADVVRRLARFSRSHPDEGLVPVDLSQLADEVVELTRPRWQNESELRGIRIDVELARGDVPEVAADPPAIREVLVNLMFNAVDALPRGGRIVVRTWTGEDGVYCSVHDTGLGMSPEVQRRVLEPFFTTKGVKSTGLGLSVNYGIIQRHGGELTIDSREGEGTTVTFRLPIAPPSSRPLASPIAKPPAERLRILLIDDDAAVRAVLGAMLTEDGHTVVEASSGAAGLAQLAAGTPIDLVLTDLGMPGMTGWEVARAAKASHPHVRVGLITGWGEEPKASPEDRAGADFILAKPLTLEALRTAMSAARLRHGTA